MHVRRNHILARQGSEVDMLYIIVSGECRVFSEEKRSQESSHDVGGDLAFSKAATCGLGYGRGTARHKTTSVSIPIGSSSPRASVEVKDLTLLSTHGFVGFDPFMSMDSDAFSDYIDPKAVRKQYVQLTTTTLPAANDSQNSQDIHEAGAQDIPTIERQVEDPSVFLPIHKYSIIAQTEMELYCCVPANLWSCFSKRALNAARKDTRARLRRWSDRDKNQEFMTPVLEGTQQSRLSFISEPGLPGVQGHVHKEPPVSPLNQAYFRKAGEPVNVPKPVPLEQEKGI